MANLLVANPDMTFGGNSRRDRLGLAGRRGIFCWVLASFLFSLVMLPVLAVALAVSENIRIEEAAYSTVLTALLVGPSVSATTDVGRVIVLLNAVVGIVMIESSMATLVTLVTSSVERQAFDESVKKVIVQMKTEREGSDEND